MEVSIQLKGVDKLMAQNRAFAGRLPGTVLNAVRRPLRRKITVIKKRLRTECGIGTSIWGKDPSGLNRIVTLLKARVSAGALVTGVKLVGIPAKIEGGGRFNPHTIRRGFGRGPIPHPGSAVRAHNIARQEMDAVAPEVMNAVREDIQKLIGKTFGASSAAA
jgi:hypothetical protein